MLLLSLNVHIHHPSTKDRLHCPPSSDDLERKNLQSAKKNKPQTNAHKCKCVHVRFCILGHTSTSPRRENTPSMKHISSPVDFTAAPMQQTSASLSVLLSYFDILSRG